MKAHLPALAALRVELSAIEDGVHRHAPRDHDHDQVTGG